MKRLWVKRAFLALTLVCALGRSAPGQSLVFEPGHWFSAFYDERLQKVVLVNGGPQRGGKAPTAPLELWSWNGSRWSLVAADPAGPKWRNFGVASYDPQRKALLVHGGRQYGPAFEDTWEWDGTRWRQYTGKGPGPVMSAEAAYDAAHGVTVMFGGNRGEALLNETWTWDGRSWRLVPVSAAAPLPRGSHTLVYDEARRTLVMYGGHFPSPPTVQNFDEQWTWNGAAWRRVDYGAKGPGVRVNARAVFEPGSRTVLLIGPTDDNTRTDVWRWDGTRWSKIGDAPFGPRNGPAVAYDKARSRVVFFGGVAVPGGPQMRDTWEFDGTRWSCVAGCG
jgi:hypothetical protein